MKNSKTSIAIFITVLLGLGSVGFSAAQPPLGLDDLKKRIQLSNSARSELISRSTGKALITLQNKKGKGFDEKYEEVKSRFKLKVSPMLGEGKWEVQWQQKDEKIRYDILMEEDKESFTLNMNHRIACNSEKRIGYDVGDNRAYITRLPPPITNPSSFYDKFDIDFFYGDAISGIKGTPSNYISRLEKKGIYPEISKSQNDNQKTIVVKYTFDRPMTEIDKTHRVVRVFEFCPEKSYSLVNYEVYNNFETDFEEMKLVYNFKGEYAESENYSGIWVLTKSTIYALNNLREENLVCEFEDVKIGVEISDEVFTFDGLGVPPGTPVRDKSLRGQPIKYYYKSHPHKKP